MTITTNEDKLLLLSVTQYLFKCNIKDLTNIANENSISLTSISKKEKGNNYYISVLYELTQSINKDIEKLKQVNDFISCNPVSMKTIEL